MLRTKLAKAIVALCAAGCSGELMPGAGDDPGTGTATLAVDGIAYASPRHPSAATAADFETEFTVRLSRGDQPVVAARVTVTSAAGKVPLTYLEDRGWVGSAAGYDQVYVLDIERGDDRLDGVRVDGPDIHEITQPIEDASIDATMPLAVAWRFDHPAQTAALWLDSGDPTQVPDVGSYTLPARTVRADKMKSRGHAVRLARSNAVLPAGAAAGSRWRVAIENAVEVVTPPLPLAR